ncbi:MAG: TlpA family protein disulfide reductase [Acidimicrobiia bacterium]
MTATDAANEFDPLLAPPRRNPARGVVFATIVVVLVVGVVFAIRLSAGEPPSGLAVLGKPTPTVNFTTLDGRTITNADLAGRTVMVNFWNTWCIPCETEAPALAAFAQQHANQNGVVLLAVVRADSEDAVRANVARAPKGWTVVFDRDQQAALGFGTRGQPETYAIAPAGTVVSSKYGPASVGELDSMFSSAGGKATS